MRSGTFPTLVLLVLFLTGGCGGSGGPARYGISGTVTYQGKPIPAGMIVFEPDSSQGNSGPAATCLIKDGKYQNQSGRGMIAGPHIVRIDGFDGHAIPEGSRFGTRLFPAYETSVNLSEESSTHDFQVPAE